MIQSKTCPRCEGPMPSYPGALCRRDNKTMICSECGEIEAFEDMGWRSPYVGPTYWKKD
jgi:RNase P subunit RPR2